MTTRTEIIQEIPEVTYIRPAARSDFKARCHLKNHLVINFSTSLIHSSAVIESESGETRFAGVGVFSTNLPVKAASDGSELTPRPS